MNLTQQEIISQFWTKYGIDISEKLICKVCDHSNNPLAPEKISYKLSFICQLTGKRERLNYWPNTLGYQGI